MFICNIGCSSVGNYCLPIGAWKCSDDLYDYHTFIFLSTTKIKFPTLVSDPVFLREYISLLLQITIDDHHMFRKSLDFVKCQYIALGWMFSQYKVHYLLVRYSVGIPVQMCREWTEEFCPVESYATMVSSCLCYLTVPREYYHILEYVYFPSLMPFSD